MARRRLPPSKAFSGHGGTTEDSHAVTPIVNNPRKSWKAMIFTFESAIASGGGRDYGRAPAPSRDGWNGYRNHEQVTLTDYLRGQMGFENLIISDDFRMEY
ncbi:MAG: glycoside hydrolase family 3 N-terminal domain-containing protein [Eubacteriales bacterium]